MFFPGLHLMDHFCLQIIPGRILLDHCPVVDAGSSTVINFTCPTFPVGEGRGWEEKSFSVCLQGDKDLDSAWPGFQYVLSFEGLSLLTGTTDGLEALFPFSFKIVTELPIPTSCIYGSPNPVIVLPHLCDGYHSRAPARASNGLALFAHLWIFLTNSPEVLIVPIKSWCVADGIWICSLLLGIAHLSPSHMICQGCQGILC